MIVYGDHALLRMRQYHIEHEQVADVIESPDITYPSWDGRRVAKRSGITVTYEQDGNDIVVITVYPIDREV
jgi:hypothetical protein